MQQSTVNRQSATFPPTLPSPPVENGTKYQHIKISFSANLKLHRIKTFSRNCNYRDWGAGLSYIIYAKLLEGLSAVNCQWRQDWCVGGMWLTERGEYWVSDIDVWEWADLNMVTVHNPWYTALYHSSSLIYNKAPASTPASSFPPPLQWNMEFYQNINTVK